MMTKFEPKYISICTNPILIVGERPNTTRDGSTLALQGNRTGDYVSEAIEGFENIILTNVTNFLYDGPFRKDTTLGDGILDLIELIETHKPRKIICLGGIASTYVYSVAKDYPLVNLPHPSWVNRFKSSDRQIFINQFKDELRKPIPANT